MEAQELVEQLRIAINRLTKEQEYFVARNERLEDENKYLKNQVDVLLRVLGKDKNEDRD